MKHRRTGWVWRPVLLAGLLAVPWTVQAQEGAVKDWRQANEIVGQYPRGHMDVLRWERKQAVAKTAEMAQAGAAFELATAADAVRAAWGVHSDLLAPLGRLGGKNVDLIASGNWAGLDAGLQRRIEGLDEILEIAATTRKAWIEAVAAQQMLPFVEDAQTAADTSAELARRMVSVGNWSRFQLAQVELAASMSRTNSTSARLAAEQAGWALLQTMGLEGVHDRVALPSRLPDATSTPISPAEYRQRLAAIQGELPPAGARRAGRDAAQGFAAYQATREIFSTYRDGILKQREILAEETQLRYNGMLESAWGLLAEAGARAQDQQAAISAQRDFLLAETDLQWVLQGGRPDAFVSPGGGGQADTVAAGH